MSDQVDLRAELSALFARARAEIDEAERRALDLVSNAAAGAPEWTSLKDAAREYDCIAETMLRYLRNYGLGRKNAGRWEVDLRRLRAWRNGEPYTPLSIADDETSVLPSLAGEKPVFSNSGPESDR